MKTLCTCLLFGALRLMAADPFTGTWKVDPSKAQISPDGREALVIGTPTGAGRQKPSKLEIANGTFKCLTCDLPVTVKADGTDQPVSGHPGFDTLSVRIVDDHHLEEVYKKAGKITFENKVAVSPDGMTATHELISHPLSSDKPVTGAQTDKRVGKSALGHAFSGTWVTEKVQDISENGLSFMLTQSGDSLKMSDATGASYDAKLDGKEHPYQGSANTDHIVLKRINARTIEETDKGGGKVLSTSRMTVSPDDRTLTMVIRDTTGHVITLVWNKQ